MVRRWAGWLSLGLIACTQAVIASEAPDGRPFVAATDAGSAEDAANSGVIPQVDGAGSAVDASSPSSNNWWFSPQACLGPQETSNQCPATWAETIPRKFYDCTLNGRELPAGWLYGIAK